MEHKFHWTFSNIPTPDRAKDESAFLANLAQSFLIPAQSAPAKNAVERELPPFDYSHYAHLEAPPSNHIEMPSSSGSRAFASQPCDWMKMPPSSASCTRAQPAPINCNEGIPCSSPTEIRPYYKSSNDNSGIKSSWAKGGLYSPTSPPYRHVQLDPESLGYFKSVEDSNGLAQPYPEPLLSDYRVDTQPALNSTRFSHLQPPRPAASSRDTQTSPEPRPFDDRVHAQPAFNSTQFNYSQPPRPAPPHRAVQPHPEPLPLGDRLQRQPTLRSGQFDLAQPPRPASSNNAVQFYPEPLPFGDRVQRQQALDRAQFNREFNQGQPPRPAPSSNAIQLYPELKTLGDRHQRQRALNRAQLEQVRRVPATYADLIKLGGLSGRSQPCPEQAAWDRPLPDLGSYEHFEPFNPLQPLRRAAAAPLNNHVHQISNNNRTNPYPAYVLPKEVFPY